MYLRLFTIERQETVFTFAVTDGSWWSLVITGGICDVRLAVEDS